MTTDSPVDPVAGHRWQRLSTRVIWVDLVQSIVSLLPAVIALGVLGVDSGAGQIWPLIGLAAVGVFGALTDALRWAFTRYRITASYVELKTGIVLRVHRSIQRDRIRSVDIEAKLRHRIAGLRVVKIGAGQQATGDESALALDALSTVEAQVLKSELLDPGSTHAEPENVVAEQAEPESAPLTSSGPLVVFARFQPRWVVYNMFNVWAYALALGAGWGTFWLLESLGLDVTGFVTGLLDWRAIGWAGTAVIALAVVSGVGALGLAANYFTEYWNFELARVRGPEGTQLRTRHGLFTTREVNRDENRIRGAQISEPLLWRWLGVSDTSVITTGLSMRSMSQPAAILPRGPVQVTRRIAAEVLDLDDNPFQVPLARHPRAALRRRLTWATCFTAGLALVLLWLAATGVLPYAALWAVAACFPVALGAAVIAYRALGHTISGPLLITRSGLVSRATTVLQRSAVSTIAISESPLQRRLGLRTVSTMTAAGHGGYDTPDIDADESLAFAAQAAPGLLDPFLSVSGRSVSES